MVGSETEILRSLHGMIHRRYPLGILYLFPTADDVSDFSSSRFKSLITDNPVTIGCHVKETDRTNLKRVGGGYLYFRGARLTQTIEKQKKSASKLKGIPTDKNIYDEVDEMPPAAIPKAQGRLKHSHIQEEVYLANPTVPDYGIDKIYNQSDQRIWMIKCEKCGKRTCLELEFPTCLERTSDDRVIRLCRHCRDREIFPRNGIWVPQYPDRTKDMVGYWISHLNSIYVDPKEILDAFEDPNTEMSDFYNLTLGMAYIEAENRLNVNDVYSCCGQDVMATRHPGPCAMGVDVGKLLHVVIGFAISEKRAKIVKLARVSNFSDVHDLANRFHVESAVIDMEPQTRTVREFQASEPYRIFLCDYQERLKRGEKIDEEFGLITVRRTEICDETHGLIKTPGRLELPRRCSEIDEYAIEMTNMVKALKIDKLTDARTYIYVNLNPNTHYRHATNYFKLALKDLPFVDVTVAAEGLDQAQTEYDLYA